MPTAPPEPDPRVLQANDRTLLSWIRTGMGVMAFGFLVARASHWLSAVAGDPHDETLASSWVGIALVVVGTAFTALASVEYIRFRRNYLAGKPMQTGRSLAVALALLLSVVGVVLAVMLSIRAG